jgi:hypothetical protein
MLPQSIPQRASPCELLSGNIHREKRINHVVTATYLQTLKSVLSSHHYGKPNPASIHPMYRSAGGSSGSFLAH